MRDFISWVKILGDAGLNSSNGGIQDFTEIGFNQDDVSQEDHEEGEGDILPWDKDIVPPITSSSGLQITSQTNKK